MNGRVRRGTWCGLTAAGLAVLLAACGGGGGGGAAVNNGGGGGGSVGGSGGSSGNTQRVARVDYDYDANGARDAFETFTYDAQGRLLERRYDYLGDGTPDREAPLGNVDYVETVAYGSGPQATRVEIVYANGDRTLWAFSDNGNGQLVRTDTTSSSGGIVAEMRTDHLYSGALQVQADSRTPPTGPVVLTQTWTHDAAGRPLTSERKSTGFLQKLGFAWNTDGTLARDTLDSNGDGAIDVDRLYTYAGGRLTRLVHQPVGAAAGQVSREHRFTYDGNGRITESRVDLRLDGSDDAVLSFSTEAGACVRVVIPLAYPLVTYDGYSSSSDQGWNFCAP